MMRGRVLPVVVVLAAVLAACGEGPGDGKVAVPGVRGGVKTSALARAERRAYDGAPPVIPHENFGATCVECHNERGMSVPEVGFAPPMPHEWTQGLSDVSRCVQCHVFQRTDGEFRPSSFAGFAQDLRRGVRLYETAPPTPPHAVCMH